MLPDSEFQWTSQREKAAHLVAEDKQSDEEIAAAVGIVKMTLERWKRHPEFQAKVAEIVEAYRQSILTQGIADVVNRVTALGDRWQRMQKVIEGRSRRYTDYREKYDDDPIVSTDFIPDEAETGLVILIETPTKNGLKKEWQVDTGLLSEMRATEKQAAQELGQWEEKTTVKAEGSLTVKVIKGVSMDEL